jgi:hypothetical protein
MSPSRAFARALAVATAVLMLHLGGWPAGSQPAGPQPTSELVAVPHLDVNVPRSLGRGSSAPVASPAETAEPALRQPAPSTGNGITLTSLHDGATLTPAEPPFVIVEGQLENASAAPVWLVVNDRRMLVPVRDGRFRQALPVLEASLVVWAETKTPDGQLDRWSRPVTVNAASPTPSGVVLVVEWPDQLRGLQAEIGAIWRERSERPGPHGQTVALKPFRTGADRDRPEVFCLEQALPGVYTFLARYAGASSRAEVRVLVHTAQGGRLRSRERRLIVSPGPGTLVLGRLLLPQGVHWDQEEWFSGKSESGDVVAKFRFPEGITWSERKLDVD